MGMEVVDSPGNGMSSDENNNPTSPSEEPKNKGYVDEGSRETASQRDQIAISQVLSALHQVKVQSRKKIDFAYKSFEEILRIIHSTNTKNQVQVVKNFYEIELISKNALLELKDF